MAMMNGQREVYVKREFLLDGIKKHYDACSSGSLEHAKAFYGTRFTYAGSSDTYFLNNEECSRKTLTHFFTKNF